MEEQILACNNEECIKKDDCQRYKLYTEGAKEYKKNSGTPEKGCKKFIEISK